MSSSLPQHIAIIMDGNGRWAQARGLSRSEGHKAGADAAKAIVTRCRERGVKHLTMYTFSKENWGRPKDEVRFLFEMLVSFLKEELPRLMERDIRLSVFGDISELPLATRTILGHAIEKTKSNQSMRLNLALNYSGREEILSACRALVHQGVSEKDITEELFAKQLYSAGQPDPDLLIRTSGEKRISNYLLFQCAYSEIYFTDIPWPDFSPQELDRAIEDYAGRQRRFGLTGEQAQAIV